jgi:hypothetical protein
MSTTGAGDAGAEGLRKRLELLTEKANAGDRQALADLRAFLDERPEIEGHVGDLARLAEAHWIETVTAGDALASEAVKRRMAQLKADLAGKNPSTVEKLVADLVVVNYVAERHAEIAAADPSTKSLDQAAFRLKRAESTQRRYLASLKMLAQLRALLPHGLAPDGRPTEDGGLCLYDPGRKTA